MTPEPDQQRTPSVLRQPLLMVVPAVALGIVANRYLASPGEAIGFGAWWLAAVLGVSVSAWLLARGHAQRSAVGLLFTACCLGGAWHHWHWDLIDTEHLVCSARHVPQPICLEVVALTTPDRSPPPRVDPLRPIPVGPRSDLTVRVLSVRDGTEWQPSAGNVRLRINGEVEQINPGDRLRLFGQFGLPSPAMNPGQYDRAAAERIAGRHVELYTRHPACVEIVERASPWNPQVWLANVSRWCRSQVSYYVGGAENPLAQAIFLGASRELPEETYESFQRTGVTHLLVVSGLHVGMLAMFVWMVASSGLLSRRKSLLVTALLVLLYALIAGGRPPVVRAAVIVFMGLASLATGRRTLAGNILAAAALVVLAMNPSELFRSGTQLSFLCVAAVVGYAHTLGQRRSPDPLERLIQEYEPWYRLAARWFGRRSCDLVAASVVVWIVAAPLVAFHFNIVSPMGFVVTPLVWPLVAAALLAGLVICTVGWLLPPAAWLFGKIAAVLLAGTDAMVQWASSVEQGHFFTGGPALSWLLVLYSGLAIYALVPRLRHGWKWQVSVVALWVSVGLGVGAWHRQPDDQLRATFLAMGHGTCVVLELPGGETVLYDAGSLGSPSWAANTISSFLWSRGISHIDAIVLSHADIDHYNAVPGLLERFGVGSIYVSPLMFDSWVNAGELTAPNYLRERINGAGVPLVEVWMNDSLTFSDPRVQIDILHPPQFGVGGNDNANSIVLDVRYAGRSALLPGDLESPGIEAVMAEPAIETDILLAPHHGSSNSDPPGFATWSSPAWVVVSGGHTAEAGELTAASYRARGGQVVHTSECGAVEFLWNERDFAISAFRPPRGSSAGGSIFSARPGIQLQLQ